MPVTPNPYIDLNVWTPPTGQGSTGQYQNPAAQPTTPPVKNNLGETGVYTEAQPTVTGTPAAPSPPELTAGKYFDPYSNTPTKHP